MKAKRESLKDSYVRQGKMADPNHVYQLDEAVPFVAECMDMCPEYEREEREYTNFLEPFEKIPGTDRVDHVRAVKRYKRSAAGDPPPLCCDVRPPKVLFKTLDYLFHDIIGTHGVAVSHSFVRDRARSIRNDLTLQKYTGVEAIVLHERIARYHIMCSNLLCGSEGFVMQQEEEQLRKTLLSLMEFYLEMTAKGVFMPNEAEFQAYYILTLPWSNDVPSRLEKELSSSVFFDPRVQLALKIRFLMTRRGEPNRPSVDGSLNHYAKIFSIIKKDSTSYLLACCIHLHFVDIRKSAIRAIQRSYYYTQADASSGLLLSDIIESLGFDGAEDASAFLNHYFITVGDGDNGRVAHVGRKVISDKNGKQKPGEYPTFPYSVTPDNYRQVKSELIESKRKGISYIDILDGKYVSLMNRDGSSSPTIISPLKRPNIPINTPAVSKSQYPFSNIASIASQNHRLSNGNLTPAFSLTTFTNGGNPAVSSGGRNNGVSFNPFTVVPPSSTTSAPTPFQLPPSSSSKAIPIIKPVTTLTTFPTHIPSQNKNSGYLPNFNNDPQGQIKSSNTPSYTVPGIKLPGSSFQLKSTMSSMSPSLPFVVSDHPVTAPPLPQSFFLNNTAPLQSITADIFDSIYRDVVRLEVDLFVNTTFKRKEKLTNEVAIEIVEDLLSVIVYQEALDRITTHRKLDNWRWALHSVNTSLCNEVCLSFATRLARHVFITEKSIFFRTRFVCDRWKFYVFYTKFQRKRQELIGKRMVTYLRQSTLLVPPTIEYLDASFTSADMNVDSFGNDDMLESRLAAVAREMQEKRATWYEKIRLEAHVLPFISALRIGKEYKMVLCTSDFPNKVSGSLGWFADTWIRSKLSTNVSDHVEDSFLREPGPSVLLDESFLFEGGEQTRIMLYHCDDTNLSVNSVRQHNSESIFSGISAALFQCEFYSSTKYQTKREYWQHLSVSLFKFASAVPLNAHIPLVLFYWPSQGLSEHHFADKFESEVSLFHSVVNPFVKISVVYLNVTTHVFDSDECSIKLQDSLIWILENAFIPPRMGVDVLSSCVTLSKKYEWTICKLEELVSTRPIYHIPKLHTILGNYMVALHNSLQEHIAKIVTDPSMLDFAYPASEFAKFPLDWNLPSSFQKLQSDSLILALPSFPQSEWISINLTQVVNMYVRYVDQLSSLPGISSSTIDSLKHCILNTSAQDLFSSARIWFSISNAAIGLFEQSCKVSARPYLLESEKKETARFARVCSNIVAEFMAHPVVLELIQSSDNCKKRKPDEDAERVVENGDGKGPKRDAQRAMEKLKSVMESASKLLLLSSNTNI